MKNKKGFTLIELLVVVVIMISILGLSIIAFNKISESNKEKAYNSVKEQVIVAAKEYFQANEYFIKLLKQTDRIGFVSLGTLVNEDYLNIVTNPKTGEKINKCAIVTVDSENKYEFIDDENMYIEYRENDGCIMSEPSIKVDNTEPKDESPENNPEDINTNFSVKVYSNSSENGCQKGSFYKSYSFNKNSLNRKTGWYNGVHAPYGLYLKIEEDENNKDTTHLFKSENSNSMCIKEDGYNKAQEIIETINVIKQENNYEPQDYTLSTNLDRKVEMNIRLDTCDYDSKKEQYKNCKEGTYENGTWKNKHVRAFASAVTDGEVSGINYTQIKTTGPTRNYTFGESTKKGEERYKYISAQGTSTLQIKICDVAGNCTTKDKDTGIDTYTIRLDRVAPTMKVTRKKCNYNSTTGEFSNCSNYSNGTWINKWVQTSMTAEDSLSGIDRSCYNTTGDTTNNSCNDTTKNTNKLSRAIFAEGVSYIRYETCDKAGNCLNSQTGATTYTIKLDRTSPKIISFENTKNKDCITSKNNECYYSHIITADDYNPNNITVSGLKSEYKYNHCYDNATNSQTSIKCPTNFKSYEKNKKEYIYPYGYATREFENGSHIQQYTHAYLENYYNLFYKIYDNAGNSTCYRYKLNYTEKNRYTNAEPVWVSGAYHCDDN